MPLILGIAVACLVIALVGVPVVVHWLRHRPHRLTQGTQHIVMVGLLIQMVLVAVAVLIAWRTLAR